MKSFTQLVSLTLSCIGLTTAYTTLPPSVDAFYQPPLGFEQKCPGDILRWRTVPPPVEISANITAAYQLLYRSTDSIGRANAVVTTIYVPPNADPKKVFSTQIAYDSAAIDCAPSYQLYLRNNTIPERELIQVGLLFGWYVSVPDYEGFTGAFTNGIQSGYAMLDSLRALTKSTNITGIRPDTRKVFAGASGGALASEWALELQPKYAPEVHIDGSLLTSITPNVTSVINMVEGTSNSGLVALGVLGLSKQFVDFSEWLSNNLIPSKAPAFLQANVLCLFPFERQFGSQQVQKSYFNRTQIYNDPVPQGVINAVGIMGLHGTPRSPIFLYQGVLDEISPVADADALVNKFCARNVSIQYTRAVNADHGTAGAQGFVAGFSWISERLNGVPVTAPCSTMNVTLDLEALGMRKRSTMGVGLKNAILKRHIKK